MKLAPLFIKIAVLSLFVGSAPALGQTYYQMGRTNWNLGKYAEARPPLLTHRSMRGGRTSEVDYMLGTSGCRVDNHRPWGARVLNFILYSYSLSGSGRTLVQSELHRCKSSAVLSPISSEKRRQQIAAFVPGATASGKLWYSGGASPVPAHPARLIRPFASGELAQRRVPLGEAERYRAMLQGIAPNGAKVKIIGRFGFVSTSGHSDKQLATLAGTLVRYTSFLRSEFGLEPPDRHISVYLSPNTSQLTKSAAEIHNLEISPSTLGYAYPEDSSISGMIPGTYAGTLLHEMFHLILRDSYGDMPQWLDEGIASLYEVSRARNGVWEGLPNWRGKLLETKASLRPSLRQVITSPWFDFDGVSGGASVGTSEARQLALSRYFALYLQSRGLLDDTFRAFQDREIGAAEDPAAEAVQIVERIAGPLATLETNFWTWFSTIGTRDDNYLPGVESKALPATTG